MEDSPFSPRSRCARSPPPAGARAAAPAPAPQAPSQRRDDVEAISTPEIQSWMTSIDQSLQEVCAIAAEGKLNSDQKMRINALCRKVGHGTSQMAVQYQSIKYKALQSHNALKALESQLDLSQQLKELKLKVGESIKPAVGTSFSDMVKKGANNFIQPSKVSSVAIYPQDKLRSSDETKSLVQKIICPEQMKLQVRGLRKTRNGGVIISTETKDDIEKLRKSEQLSQSGLTVDEPFKRKPRVVILGVPSSMAENEVFACLYHQNLAETLQDCSLEKFLTLIRLSHKSETTEPAPSSELDKFKRRLIRAVARLLLQEKKPEEEIWKDLKKETGCDCEILWIRMRALTLKKLHRLLAADDCMTAVPKAAQMSMTDWLLVDLVLVHQKIDFIGQNVSKTKDLPALVELFKLVKMFKLEEQSSNKLAEAWSLATLSYINKGHHCSAMLLQRRWYQLKEVTRTNFYKFWYMYRGSVQRIDVSEPFKPSPLQTDIARTFKELIVQPYETWEELIETKKVIMPDEFDRIMEERVARRTRSTSASLSTEDVPDLVMIEPRIETIDLRLEPDDNATEEDKQEEDGEVPVPPLVPIVKIKQEPQDDVDETQIKLPKKSIYEVVLESTALEYEQIDSMDAEDFSSENYDGGVEEIEEPPVRDEVESTMPQISNVFGNVSDTSVLANINEDRVHFNTENSEANDINTEAVSDTIVLDDIEVSTRGNDRNTDACEIIVNDNASAHQSKSGDISRNNDKVIQIRDTGNDTDVCDVVKDVSNNVVEHPGVGDNVGGPGDVNVISDDDDDISAKADAALTGKVDETSVIGKICETNVIDNFEETAVTGNADDICVNGKNEGTSALIPSENITVSNTQTAYPTVIAALNAPTIITVTDSPSKDVEIIDTASHPVVVVHSDDDDDDIVKTKTNNAVEDIIKRRRSIDQPMEVDATPQVIDITSPEPLKVGLIAEGKDGTDIKPDVTGFNFGELPLDISFVDEGIEFVDDGIIYVDEDEHDEPNIKSDAGNEDEDTPKIDAKLLMCPLVYTTKLDDMYMFYRQSFDHVTDKHLLDDIAKESKPIKQEPKETVENVTINYLGENIESVTVNNTKTIEHVQKTVSTIEKVTVNNDTIEIIKKEPVIINSETSADVELNPENDDNVTSDDDYSEYVIDESQKVKPTSYLLQKPRSRRYNPIQLCKNPDFNTRLKRLSLGFYSHPRNRLLIKSCKPLTIDLSKAFESKLVSGTLYLKPLDHNVVTEVIDDTQSQNVSVLPSALPAQSLIDNSKVADILPMLRQCLEDSKQHIQPPPEILPTPTENKVVNLPDITEIRRINQRLLTVEVTPIQVHNNQPQVPVSIVSSPITLTYTAQNPATIPDTEQDLRLKVTEANDARGPPKLLDITDDLPAKSSTIQHPTTTTHSNNTHTSTGRNTFDILRPRLQASFSGRPPRMQNGKRLFPPKLQKPPIWKPRQFRAEIPWLSRSNEVTVTSMMNETLLTYDALNKMLFLLTKTPDVNEIAQKYLNRKAKCKSKSQQKKRGRPKTNPGDSSVVLVSDKEDEASETQNCATQKPKFNVKPATNYPPVKEKIGAVTDNSKKKVKYCCWCKQRMLQLLFNRAKIPQHACPRLCGCCCRHLLADYILQDQKIKNAEEQRMRAAYRITQESEENTNTNSSETFEANFARAVVISDQVCVLETVPEETPAVNVHASNTESTANNTTTANQPIAIEDIEDDVPALGSEVSVETTAVLQTASAVFRDPPSGARDCSCAPRPVRRTLMAVPIPKNTKYVLPREKPETVTSCISSDKLSGGVISIVPPNATKSPDATKSPNTIKSPSTTIVPTMPSPPSLSKFLAVKKAKAGPCSLKTNIPTPPPLLKQPFVPPKHFKEKMIFLNSKQISETPTASPVFLGKNKILLTTVKFPPNLKLFQESKKALQSSLNLPDGVHVILLADGSISYKIEPNVEVNAMDMAEMRSKISAIQEYMNLHAAQEEEKKKQNVPLAPAATESEVVDLVGDDDDSASNVKDHQNTESALVTEVQITEGSVTINSVDSPDVGHNSKTDTSKETEENLAAKNMKNYVNNDIENKQNETTDRCTVTDIQEGVKETSQNEMVSVSTEQVQYGSSIEKVSAEIDDQLKPPSQTETTDVYEVSAGLVQSQSEPSGQKVSTEVQDHPEPATQNVSTEELEESRSKPSRPKTKNILSDLMEMSGIFDEDMTPEVEEAVVEPSVQEIVAPPVCTGTRPIIPSTFNPENSVPPKVSSPVGELTPITSLYELKYACANKGIFFKLDFETGYLVPINVCMKTARPKATQQLALKSVIDLTDDDDKQEHEVKQLDSTTTISPTKMSLLLANNKFPGDFAGPVKPVKLFKAPKANILRRLNINNLKGDSVNPLFDRSSMNHTIKRRQFLKNINMNADLSAKPWRCSIKRIRDPNEAVQKSPTPTTSCPQPVEQFATTILSDGDSSDDEPLAKIAKRQNENANAAEENRDTSGSEICYRYKNLESSAADVEPEASVEPLIEIELPAADDENTMNDDDLGDGETPVEEQNESELTADTEPVYMSEDENDFMDQEAPFGPNENDEEEDLCILGV